MGNKSSLMLQDDDIKEINKETGFTPSQIEKLYSRFAHLDRSNGGSLNRTDLLSIPELAINPLCDRLIQMFFSDCEPEDDRINFKQFMRVLATFRSSTSNPTSPITVNKNIDTSLNQQNHTHNLSRHTQAGGTATGNNNNDHYQSPTNGSNNGLKNKLQFVFKIYDADNDGRISFNDIRSILKMMVGNYIEDVQLDKIATRAFVEVDEDCDGFIDFNEFCKVFRGKNLDDKLRVKFFN